MPKLGTKDTLFGSFLSRILKNYCHIWNQFPQICAIVKFPEKRKMPNLGTKNALFGYFLTRISKTIAIFEVCILKVVKLQNFTKKQNCLNFWPRKKIRAEVRLIHAEQMSYMISTLLGKKQWTQMKTKQLKQGILNH